MNPPSVGGPARRCRSDQAGFSLLDVTVAVVVLLVILLPIASLLTSTTKVVYQSQFRQTAQILASSRIDQLRIVAAGSLTGPGNQCSSIAPATYSVYAAPFDGVACPGSSPQWPGTPQTTVNVGGVSYQIFIVGGWCALSNFELDERADRDGDRSRCARDRPTAHVLREREGRDAHWVTPADRGAVGAACRIGHVESQHAPVGLDDRRLPVPHGRCDVVVTRRQTVRRQRAASEAEAGTSLVELITAMGVLAVVMAMTVVIVTVVTKTSSTGSNQGAAADYAASDANAVDSFVRGAVSPYNAAQASQQTASSSGPCWGTTSPDPLATGPPPTAAWPAPPSAFQLEETGIIVAHDFDMEWCGYPPGASGSSAGAPHVYEAYIDKTTCSGVADGSCTLKIVDYGAGYQGQSEYDAMAPGLGTVVGSISNLWCDSFCRAGIACSSYLADASAPPQTGCSAPTVAYTTPPLFNYFGSAGVSATTSANGGNGSLNLDSPLLDLASASDDLSLSLVRAVIFSVTVLSQPNLPVSTTSPRRPPGVSVSDQIYLPALGQTNSGS